MDNSQKLLGTLRLNLDSLKSDIGNANNILKDLEKIKIDSIDDDSGKKSIEILHQLESAFQNLKTASGNSFDTSIFSKIEETIKNLGVNISQTTTKITDITKTNMAGLTSSVTQAIEKIDELNRKTVESTTNKFSYDKSGNVDGVTQTTKTTTTNDFTPQIKAETKARQELDDAISKTIENRQKEEKLLEENQTKAINKSIEQEYADRQKLTEQIYKENDALDTYKSKMQNNVNKLFVNDVLPKDKLLSFESELEKLNLGSTKSDFQTIENSYKNLLDDQNKLNSAKKEELSSQKEAITYALKEQDAQQKIADVMEKQNLASLKQYTQDQANSQQYNKMSQQLASISGEQQLAMGSMGSQGTIGDRFKNTGAYALAASSIYMVQGVVKDAIKTNQDYEMSLQDLGRVLGNVTQQDLQAYGQQAIQFAKDFGVPLQSVQDAMSSLAAAGVQDKASLSSMTNTVMMGVNTSDIKDASQMTDLLTSSIKQLGLSYSDSEKVLDSWNASADKHIAKTSDYAQAVSKAGMTSKIMGVDINELNGIISVMADNTGKSGSEIGDSLKSVETRLERPKTLKTLQQYGIEVMKDSTHFKDFGDIVKEISDALAKYGDNTIQSNAILDAVGGTMRKDDFAVLAQNWNQVGEAAKQSADSAGYSATKNAATMDTLAKKVEVFNATIKEFYISLGNGGLLGQLKGLVDLGTWIAKDGSGLAAMLLRLGEATLAVKAFSGSLQILTGMNLTQKLDALKNIPQFNIGGVNFGGATTSVKAYESAVQSLTDQITKGNITAKESSAILEIVGEKCGLATSSTNTYAAAQKALENSTFASTEKGKALATEMEALNETEKASIVTDEEKVASNKALDAAQKTTAASALGLKLAMAGLTIGLTFVVSELINFVSWLTQADQRQQEALQNGADAAKQYADEQKSIGDLINQYSQLDASGKTDTDTKNQLLNVQQQLIGKFGDEAQSIDLVNGKYQDQIDKIQQLNKAKADQNVKSNQSNFNDAQNALNEVKTYSVDPGKKKLIAPTSETGDVNRIIDILNGTTGVKKDQYSSSYNITGDLQTRVDVLGAILDKTKGITDINGREQALVKQINDEYNTLSKNLNNANITSKNMFSDQLVSQYSSQLGKITKDAEDMQKAMNSGNATGAQKIKDDYNNLINSMDKTLEKNPDLQQAFKDWVQGLDMTSNAADGAASSIDAAKQAQQQLADSMDQSIGNIKDYAGYIKEMNDNGGHLSADSMQQLIKNHADLAPYLGNEQILYQKIQEAIGNEKDTATQAYQSMMTGNADYYASNTNLKNAINNSVDDIYKKYSNYFTAKADDLKKEVANAKTAAEAEAVINADLNKKKAEADKAYMDAKSKAQTAALGDLFKGGVTSPLAMGQDAGKFIGNDVNNNPDVKKAKDYADSIQSAIDDANKQFDAIINGNIQMPDALKNLDTTTEGLNKTTAQNAQALKEQKQQMAEDSLSTKDYDNAMAKLDLTMKSYDNTLQNVYQGSQQYRDVLKEKLGLLKQELDLTNQQIKINDQLASQYSAMGTQTFTSTGSDSSGSSSSSGGSTYNGQYSSMINAVAGKYGVDPALIAAVIQQESGWNPNAVSGAGAKGLMQKMEGTNLFDPASNIDQGTSELAQDLKALGGNVQLALAAYNAGLGNVQKYGGIPPFAETQNYVPSVMKYYQQYKGGKAIPNGGSTSDAYTQEQATLNYQQYAQQAQQQSLSEQAKAIDLQQQIAEIPYLNFQSVITELEDKTKAIDSNVAIAKAKSDALSESFADGTGGKIDLGWQQFIGSEEKVNELNREQQYIQGQLNSGQYTSGQLDQMKQKLLDVQQQTEEAKVSMQDLYKTVYDTAYTSRVQPLQDSLTNIKNQISDIKIFGIDTQTEMDLTIQQIDNLKKQKAEVDAMYNELATDLYRNAKNMPAEVIVAAQEQLQKFATTSEQLNNEILSTMNSQFDLYVSLQNEQIKKLDNSAALAKSSLDLLSKNDVTDRVDATNEQLTDASLKLIDLNNQVSYLKNQIGSGKYNDAELQKLNDQLATVEQSAIDTKVAIKQLLTDRYENDYKAQTNDLQNDLTSIQGKISEIKATGLNDQEETLLTGQLVDNLSKQRTIAQGMLQDVKSYYEQIKNNETMYKEEGSALEEEITTLENRIQDFNTQIAQNISDMAKQYVQEQQKYDQAVLDNNKQVWAKQYFGVSQSDWDKYRQTQLGVLNDQLSTAQQLADLHPGDLEYQDGVIAKQNEINDLQSQQYSNITDWETEFNKVHQARIDQLQQENQLEQEAADRLARQNALIQDQIQLKQDENNQNIQTMKQNADGTWQVSYTYDRSAVDKDLQTVGQQKLDNQKAENDLALQQETQYEQELMQTQKNNYDEQVKVAQDAYDQKYKDIDYLTQQFLDGLVQKYGDNTATLSDVLSKGLSNMQGLYQDFADNVNGLLDGIAQKMDDTVSSFTDGILITGKIQSSTSNSTKSKIPQDELNEVYNNAFKAIASANNAVSALNNIQLSGSGQSVVDTIEKSAVKFDTGGETPNWSGSDGKLAILHPNEKISNAQDTKKLNSLLDTAEETRSLGSILDQFKPTAKASNMFASPTLTVPQIPLPTFQIPQFQMPDFSGLVVPNSNIPDIQQSVTIHADFPDVSSSIEIQKAFDGLLSGALQHAMKK